QSFIVLKFASPPNTMSTESSLKDLPKVDTALKGQLEGFSPDKLKKTDTAEKTALPTKEDVAQEKQHNELLENISQFRSERLKRTSTSEKIVLPTPEDVEAEKQAKAHLEAVEGFNSANLKHASTQEKIILPAKEDIET
ncbi:hypothetical protein CGJ15_25980, partial [Vibrio parahaemolyticus]